MPSPPDEVTPPLDMPAVYTLSYVAALQRSYPVAIADAIAAQVLWLEQRALPGIIALAREFLLNRDVPPQERGLQCPFIGGAKLINDFDKLVSKDPSRPSAIQGPSNGVLILPVVAEYAKKIGEPVRVSWLMNEPSQIAGQSVTDGNKVMTVGDANALLLNTGVAFARHGMPMEQGVGPECTVSRIPKDVLGPFLKFVSPERRDAGVKVLKILNEDRVTLGLLRELSDGDRSVLAAGDQLKSDDRILLTTAPGSTNDKLWARLESYGWTQRAEAEGPEEIRKLMSQFALLDAGRAAVPLLFHALDRFPPALH